MSDEQAIETAIQEKGLKAPRLTPADIDAAVIAEQFYVFPGTVMTVCCLTLANGYNVIGESAPVSSDNFDQEIGRRVARQKARDKVWSLEGYLLRQRVHAETAVRDALRRSAT